MNTGNPYAVTASFLADVVALREILKTISTPNDRWWIEKDSTESVLVAYDPEPTGAMPGINCITFQFPKVKFPKFPKELRWMFSGSNMVCMHPVARVAGQQGLYMDDSRLVGDDFRDWERFWPPLRKGLEKAQQALAGTYSLDSQV